MPDIMTPHCPRVPTTQISARFVLDERGARRSPSSAMASAWRDIQDEEEDDEDDAHVEVRSSTAFRNARGSRNERGAQKHRNEIDRDPTRSHDRSP